MKDRAATDAVNGNSIDQVSFSVRLSSTHSAGEEAEGVRRNGRKTEPSDVEADRARRLHWQQSYGALREFKLRFEKQHNR